jgi:mannan endo-1,4-beta-mannosidase
MSKTRLLFLFLTIFSIAVLIQCGNSHNFSKEVSKKEALLTYLKQLPEKPNSRLISGALSESDDLRNIYEQSGKVPGLLGVEYCVEYGYKKVDSASQAVDWKKMNSELIPHWKKGGIVRILTHFPNPTNLNYGGLRDTVVNFEAIMTTGTPERGRWLALLDEVAKGLQELIDNGVIPIYGPMHESNGPYFWWGTGNLTALQQKALWIDLHNYITEEKGCKGVIWLFTPLCFGLPINNEAYPEGFVDMVGLDVYYELGMEKSLNLGQDKYELMISKEKPFIISEFGPHEPYERGINGPYDYTLFLQQIKKFWPKTVAYMTWKTVFSPGSNLKCKELMTDEWVINQDNISYPGR